MTQTDIVIAGGGSAGWMVAAAFAHFLPSNAYRIRLIESEAIGTIGVGEATIPQIQLFNQALGLDEDAFLRATGGTFKLGIEFAGWTLPGERYMHAFGDVGREAGLLAFHHRWLRAHGEGAVAPLGSFSLNEVAARALKMQRGPARTAAMLGAMPYAFHFDAALYARLLRRFAETRGVERVEGRIVSVERNGETGDIDALTLEGGARVSGDLFVDCTGFRALLIGEGLGVGYDDWTRWLPCDRALAVPSARAAEFTPYTRATAHAAGWQWRIPLQHRTGNGIVYSSAHLSDDEAAAHLLANLDGAAEADPRPIRFTTGKRREMWRGNVVAVGLASGFMEPLESTSLHLVQTAIARLLKMLPGRASAQAQRDEYNRQADFEYERIRDFLVLHYHANARDEPFWQERRTADLPDTLREKLDVWREQAHVTREHEELFTEVAWIQVLIGQGVIPRGYHPIADAETRGDNDEYLDLMRQLIAREAAQMPRHDAFVAQHCAARAPA
jgi:tryptophan halogenase